MDNENKEQESMQTQTDNRGFFARHKIALVLLLCFLAFFGYRIYQYLNRPVEEAAAEMVNVMVEQAVLEDIDQQAPVTGRLEPVEEVAIIPMAQGQVTRVYVSVGDKVSKGQTLFTIDSSSVAAQLNQAKVGVDAAQSAYDRMQTLYNEGAVSAQDLESVKTQYLSARESYNQVAELISNYTVTSPITGYVTSLSVSAGSMAGGSMAGSVANIDSLVINTAVSENMAAKIAVGDPVEVYISSLGQTYAGTVTTFSRIPSIGTLTYPVTITMEANEDLFAGQFAEVHLTSETASNTITVSSQAVIIKGGRSVVCVVDPATGIPAFREVTVGIDNGTRVQILDGLAEGETVVYSGQQFVTEGEAVVIVGE
ncbi:MAG: efflux RND transporter periplasmic adaptor subunit [Firmicutes bacterium]|nr:efflux RND transporter periplasmic adaptor subunit [Bacillota bacterium]